MRELPRPDRVSREEIARIRQRFDPEACHELNRLADERDRLIEAIYNAVGSLILGLHVSAAEKLVDALRGTGTFVDRYEADEALRSISRAGNDT